MVEKITRFFEGHPNTLWLIIAAIGLLILLGSLFNWDWMYADKHDKWYAGGRPSQ